MSDEYDDRPHVDAYRAAVSAGDDQAAQEAAAAIVETHLGFLRQYAAQNYFGSLTRDQWEEYLHELVIVALERVPDYDPDRGSFPTYVKPYLQKVRWQIAAGRRPVKVSVFTQRMIALAEQTIAAFHVTEGRDPSPDELSELLSDASGRRIGPAQAARLAQGPARESIDGIDVPVDEAEDHADVIADVIAGLEVTPLAELILGELSASGKWTPTAAARVANTTGIPVEVVEHAAWLLIERLRDELAG